MVVGCAGFAVRGRGNTGGGNRLPPGKRKVRHEAEITVPRPDVRHLFAAVFIILSGGFQDAYTYCCRGSVFANAQTGNIVLLSAALFRGEWRSCQGALRLFPQSRQADASRRTDLFWCHCRVCRRSGHRKLSDGARRRAGDLGLLRVAFRQLCHDVCPRGQVTRPANFSCAKRKSVLEYDHDFIKEEFRYVEKNP